MEGAWAVGLSSEASLPTLPLQKHPNSPKFKTAVVALASRSDDKKRLETRGKGVKYVMLGVWQSILCLIELLTSSHTQQRGTI